MDLFTNGKMTLKLFRLIELQLSKLPLAKIKAYKVHLESQNVELPDNVQAAFDALFNEKLQGELKRRKVHAMYLYDQL